MKKIIKLYVTLALFIGLSACDDEETLEPVTSAETEESTSPMEEGEDDVPEIPAPEIFFTYKVLDPHPSSGISEDWVIVHDSLGNLIDYQEYNEGDKLEFITVPDSITSYISVTRLSMRESPEGKRYIITSYGEVPRNSNFDNSVLNTTSGTLASSLGQIDVEIINVPANLKYQNVYTKYGKVSQVFSTNTGILTFQNVEHYANTDYTISLVDEDDNVKLLIDEPVVTSGKWTIDYTTLQGSDSEVPITLPQYSNAFVSTTGLVNDLSRLTGNTTGITHDYKYENPQAGDIIKAHYLSNYSNYFTMFSYNTTGYNYSYKLVGAALDPSYAPPVAPTVTYTSTDINSFELNASSAVLMKSGIWSYRENTTMGEAYPIRTTSWTVHSSENHIPQVTTIPASLLAMYPDLNINKLQFLGTKIRTKGNDYAEELTYSFYTPSFFLIGEHEEFLLYN